MCRIGQFTQGDRDLCIGLDYNTIKSTKEFWCYLGKNRKVHYEIESAKALEKGQKWTNAKGKLVFIVPIKEFNVVVSEWDREEYERKQQLRDNIVQQKLL